MRNAILLNNEALDSLNALAIRDDFASFNFTPEHHELMYIGELMSGEIPINESTLSQLLLYDDLYLVNPKSFINYEKLAQDFNIHIVDESPLIEKIDKNYAEYLKPIVLNSMINYSLSDTSKLLNNELSFLYDNITLSDYVPHIELKKYLLNKHGKILGQMGRRYLPADVDISTWGYDLIGSFFCDHLINNIVEFITELILNAEMSVTNDAVIYGSKMDFTKIDYKNNHTQCYQLLRMTCHKEHVIEPYFDNLSDFLRFKKKNKLSIHRLREVLSNLENTFRNDGREEYILKAEREVLSARKSLLKNSTYTKVSKRITYLSLPISIAETIFHGSYIGLAFTTIGFLTTLAGDINDIRNNWINLVI